MWPADLVRILPARCDVQHQFERQPGHGADLVVLPILQDLRQLPRHVAHRLRCLHQLNIMRRIVRQLALRYRKPHQKADGFEIVLLSVGALALQERQDALLSDRGDAVLAVDAPALRAAKRLGLSIKRTAKGK